MLCEKVWSTFMLCETLIRQLKANRKLNRSANDIYVLTEEREINLWRECIFIFDSSALLDLYYYPEITRKDIYEQIFETQQNRIWIPNHVQYEYLKNRESVIQKPITESYKPLVNDYLTPIVGTIKTLEEKIKSLKEATKKKGNSPVHRQLPYS